MSDTTSNTGAGARAPLLSRFQRNLRLAYSEGRIDCNIEAHFMVRAWTDAATGRRFTDVQCKPNHVLFDMMMPGQLAKCPCLKRACESMWRRNFHGAYTTTAIAPGSYTKGVGPLDAAPKQIASLNYTLKPDEFKFLVGRFPERHFMTLRHGAHDHPIAHTSTRLAAERLMDRLPRGTAQNPLVYVDLHGNPGANERYMLRNPGITIISIVEAVTPKDYTRKVVKWGDRVAADGRVRWICCSLRDIGLGIVEPFGDHKISGFISIHTLYYYDHAEVVRALNRFDCPMYAAHHRYSHPSGSLNNGEMTYVKRQRSSQTIIYQTTTTNGAEYSHPDNSVWFDYDSLTYGDEGIGWDHNLLCDETHFTLIVPVPRVQCEMSEACLCHEGTLPRTRLPLDPGRSAQSLSDIASSNTMVISVGDFKCSAPISSQHVSYFDDMRKHAVGKQRTSAQYKDHISRCKIAAASLTKTGKFSIDAQELDQISRFSFFMDLPDQLQLDSSLFDQHRLRTLAASSLERKGKITHVAATAARTLCEMVLAAAECSTTVKAAVKVGRIAVASFD
jgi:hypothetical protein